VNPKSGTKLETMDTDKGRYLRLGSASREATGGQGVHREVGSEGLAEKHRVVVEQDEPVGQDREWSSLHYGGEGVWFPPIATGCVRTTR